jgi:uncharacterized protein YdhG (YjbR/CyaY superfamily)
MITGDGAPPTEPRCGRPCVGADEHQAGDPLRTERGRRSSTCSVELLPLPEDAQAMAARPPARTKTAAKIAASVDDYLARLDEPERTTLAKLRAQIRQAAPEASEVISYQIPTYRQNGPLVHFAAQPKHLSFTVVSLDVMNAFRDELQDFEVSGRTIRFSAKKPLPAALVKRIVKARVLENEARDKR